MLRQTDDRQRNKSTSKEALRMLWRAEGGPLRRLWAGYTALAARNLPFTAMQFPMFEFVRGKIWGWRDRRLANRPGGESSLPDTAASGDELQIKLQDQKTAALGVTPAILETGWVTGASAAVSGSIAAVLTTPTDVVKTRMMLTTGDSDSAKDLRGESRQTPDRKGRMGGLDTAKLVIQERGIKGLFRGGLLRAGWTAVGSGLYLGTYEMAKVWLKGGQIDRDLDDL